MDKGAYLPEFNFSGQEERNQPENFPLISTCTLCLIPVHTQIIHTKQIKDDIFL